MRESVYEILSKIEKLNKDIASAENVISCAQVEFNNKTREPQNIISSAKAELRGLESIQVKASVGDVLEALAGQWGVDSNTLEVSVNSNFCAVTFTEPTIEEAKRAIQLGTECYHNLNILITESKKKYPFRFESFSMSLDLREPQADHKLLDSHIIPQITAPNDYGEYNILIGVDDVKKIALGYKIKELVRTSNGKIVPKDDKSKAMLDASQKYVYFDAPTR